MKKFAVILSGCGVYDGSEIHEATLALLAIKKQGATYDIFAPDMPQHHVINHLTGEVMSETRNVLVESARIARGKIAPLDKLNPALYDALMLPGGFGAAKNLSSYAFDGSAMTVNPLLKEKLTEAHNLGKVIGALCIAPVILAHIFDGIKLTIGTDTGTAADINSMGARHIDTPSGGVACDKENKIFTTPCYMLDGDIARVAESCENIVKAMMEVM
ncbi:MAG: Enhancing lycopene biosynthesis protein 2 [Bacteroidetes bacterium ADurb.Bin408]|nr:MAG: Enhancing lycopene biosynthesis protein 2 [Bacteroidetes bacterium ADurb.Bin408]